MFPTALFNYWRWSQTTSLWKWANRWLGVRKSAPWRVGTLRADHTVSVLCILKTVYSLWYFENLNVLKILSFKNCAWSLVKDPGWNKLIWFVLWEPSKSTQSQVTLQNYMKLFIKNIRGKPYKSSIWCNVRRATFYTTKFLSWPQRSDTWNDSIRRAQSRVNHRNFAKGEYFTPRSSKLIWQELLFVEEGTWRVDRGPHQSEW